MVNNDTNFKSIELLRCWCMKSLPTVFSDALSYNQQVCMLTQAINEMSSTINGLPDYIVALVKELLEMMNLEEIVKKVLSDLYFINVKNPPSNMTPALGDGTSDDTIAIQAMIDYASEKHSYLFFPTGNYLVSGITMKENVSLIGLDRYSSIITLTPNANTHLITGVINHGSISNLTLNANMNAQVINCSCINANIDNSLINFLIFKNGYDSVIINCENEIKGLCWLFDGIQHTALTINGNNATLDDIIFTNASQLNSDTLIIVNGSNKITGIYSNTNIPKGVILTTSGSTIEGNILNTSTPISDGENNYITLITDNGLIEYRPELKTFIGNYEENISGSKTTTTANLLENISGSKTTTTANLLENISGSKTIESKSITENISTNKYINANNIEETIDKTKSITSENITENISNSKTITATDFVLNLTNPLTYKAPQTINKYFNYVEFKNNSTYKVLVAGDKLDELNTIIISEAENTDITQILNSSLANSNVILDGKDYIISSPITIPNKRALIGNNSKLTINNFTGDYAIILGTDINHNWTNFSNTFINGINVDCLLTTNGILVKGKNCGLYNSRILNSIIGIDVYEYDSSYSEPADFNCAFVEIYGNVEEKQTPQNYAVRINGTDSVFNNIRTLNSKTGFYVTEKGGGALFEHCHTLAYLSDQPNWETSTGWYIKSNCSLTDCYSDNSRFGITIDSTTKKISINGFTYYCYEFTNTITRYAFDIWESTMATINNYSAPDPQYMIHINNHNKYLPLLKINNNLTTLNSFDFFNDYYHSAYARNVTLVPLSGQKKQLIFVIPTYMTTANDSVLFSITSWKYSILNVVVNYGNGNATVINKGVSTLNSLTITIEKDSNNNLYTFINGDVVTSIANINGIVPFIPEPGLDTSNLSIIETISYNS